ncbi:MAG: membrane protein insertion efficiency factor YidD [Candidatus Omnitrophica bacterium]|nr:membrane protein insertion efficiency factor YidD [Candidatus Omnitrophota bacterium]
MARRAVIVLIVFYQRYLRVGIPRSCRFEPSCSEYALEALTRYGLFKGGLKALRRILSCHPFSGKSGYDPLV